VFAVSYWLLAISQDKGKNTLKRRLRTKRANTQVRPYIWLKDNILSCFVGTSLPAEINQIGVILWTTRGLSLQDWWIL